MVFNMEHVFNILSFVVFSFILLLANTFVRQDMEEELKAMKAARAGEKLAERDADPGTFVL